MEKDLGQIFNELKNDISTYAELKFELLKLNTYERSGKLVALLSYGLVALILGFFATLFLFLALGILLGQVLNSYTAGFAIVGGIYLLSIGILMMFKKRFLARVTNIVIDALDGPDDNNNETSYEKRANTAGEIDFE